MHQKDHCDKAITAKVNQQNEFKPPYCPNPQCKFHRGGNNFHYKNGWTRTEKAPFYNRRYKCADCGKQFSYNTFSLGFRRRIVTPLEEIHFDSMNAMTNHSIARKHKLSEGTIRSILSELARQSMLTEKKLAKKLIIDEKIAYDGFESFCGSQFSPNYINTAVGKKSLYCFPETYSYLNRKGRMNDKIRAKNESLIKRHGRYPSNSIRVETTNVIQDLLDKSSDGKITLHTDGHCSYLSSINNDFPRKAISHIVTSSKEVRDGKNNLFPINHLHGRYRHFLSSHRRETIAFHKNEAGLMDKITISRIYKNFMCPQLYRRKRNKRFNTHSPAMALKLVDHILTFKEVFPYRRMSTQYDLTEQEKAFFKRKWDHSREVIAENMKL